MSGRSSQSRGGGFIGGLWMLIQRFSTLCRQLFRPDFARETNCPAVYTPASICSCIIFVPGAVLGRGLSAGAKAKGGAAVPAKRYILDRQGGIYSSASGAAAYRDFHQADALRAYADAICGAGEALRSGAVLAKPVGAIDGDGCGDDQGRD
jgi:hypothetical protein